MVNVDSYREFELLSLDYREALVNIHQHCRERSNVTVSMTTNRSDLDQLHQNSLINESTVMMNFELHNAMPFYNDVKNQISKTKSIEIYFPHLSFKSMKVFKSSPFTCNSCNNVKIHSLCPVNAA